MEVTHGPDGIHKFNWNRFQLEWWLAFFKLLMNIVEPQFSEKDEEIRYFFTSDWKRACEDSPDYKKTNLKSSPSDQFCFSTSPNLFHVSTLSTRTWGEVPLNENASGAKQPIESLWGSLDVVASINFLFWVRKGLGAEAKLMERQRPEIH